MTDFQTAQQLWAPWRMEFIRGPKEEGCFLCRIARDGPAKDAVQARLDAWLKMHVTQVLAPLVALRDAADIEGLARGIAFQLVDAAIDYVSDGETMGKDAGDDFRDGKVTLPVILAHSRGDAEEKKFWHNAMLGHRVSADDLAYAIGLLRKYNAIEDTLERARHYGQRAIDALAPFPASAAKDALVEAVEFAIARAY